VAQVIECLTSKCETLSSNPSTAKKQNKTKIKNHSVYFQSRLQGYLALRPCLSLCLWTVEYLPQS
jgi:hypothetical protein